MNVISKSFITSLVVGPLLLLVVLAVGFQSSALSQPVCTPVPFDASLAVSDGGFAYIRIAKFGTLPDYANSPLTTDALTRSKLRVFENEVELVPHSTHVDIRNLGKGRFSHWGKESSEESLRFSATDNSDPRKNGKKYASCVAGTTPPVVDTTKPSIPAEVTRLSQVIVSWKASTDNVGVVAYQVHRDGVKIGTPVSGTVFVDNNVRPGSYEYTVVAVDAAGNASDQSEVMTVVLE